MDEDELVPPILRPAIRELVHELVLGNYGQLEVDGRSGGLTAAQLREAVDDYGQQLVDLPDTAFDFAWACGIDNLDSTWAVDIDMWTREAGRSDLTLRLTCTINSGCIETQITDLHVL